MDEEFSFMILKHALTSKCNFVQMAHCHEQTLFTRVFPPGTHLSPESTEAMQIKCLAQGHNILMQPGV